MPFATLLELQLVQGTLFKNVLEVISDLFSEAYFDFSATGFKLQAVDTRCVALVELLLRPEAFKHYRCNRDLSMGLNLADMAKVFRWANKDDIITIKSEEDMADVVTCTFESAEDGEISHFDFEFVSMNGLPIEIPESTESEYQARIRMPSAKFMGICNKLSSFEDSEDSNVVVIFVDKESVRFFAGGKTGSSSIVCQADKILTCLTPQIGMDIIL